MLIDRMTNNKSQTRFLCKYVHVSGSIRAYRPLIAHDRQAEMSLSGLRVKGGKGRKE